MTHFFKFGLMALMPVIAATSAMSQEASRLELKVETAQTTGAVMVALFDNEEAYENGAPVRVARLDASAGEGVTAFEGLEAGVYGIKAFHDVNGNGQMDTNPFGMPVEPYAFSNNAVGNMGPAKWDRARFEVSGVTTHTLSLR